LRAISIHKFRVLPATETMVVSGELIQLHLDEKRLGIYYAPAKKVIHCSYEPELEDYIVACLREIIQVYGQVQLDNRGIPEKIVDVIEIENLDLSPLKIREILFENKKLMLRDELSISIGYDQENQEFSLEYLILNISIGAKDRQAILDEFYADFYWVWLEYGICDDAQMSDDARLLKESVCGMVVEGLSPSNLSRMARQCQLNGKDFELLIDCPLSQSMYEMKLINKENLFGRGVKL